jgi:hypothetical protein
MPAACLSLMRVGGDWQAPSRNRDARRRRHALLPARMQRRAATFGIELWSDQLLKIQGLATACALETEFRMHRHE